MSEIEFSNNPRAKMSASKFIKSESVIAKMYGHSRAQQTVSRLFQLGLMSRRSEKINLWELAFLIYFLTASGKTENVFKVYESYRKTTSHLTGDTFVQWLHTQLELERPFEGIDQLLFSTGAYGQVFYLNGQVQTFGRVEPGSEYNGLGGEDLRAIVAEYEAYMSDETLETK